MGAKRVIAVAALAVALFSAGLGAGWILHAQQHSALQEPPAQEKIHTASPSYEYLAGGAAWQLSAESKALMLQAFNAATECVDEMVRAADAGSDGYAWSDGGESKALLHNGKRVAVVCDLDDTLIDGAAYTAGILGNNSEWSNPAFARYLGGSNCTALPGAVAFAQHVVDSGITLFYVTNRSDEGYASDDPAYEGQTGYADAEGNVVGSSIHDLYSTTMYDLTMSSLDRLGFPINMPDSPQCCENAFLIVNDGVLNGSSKELVRETIATESETPTGERASESDAYPASVHLDAHDVMLLLGDDLNDFSDAFSLSENDAVERVDEAIRHSEYWGARWIVLPNAMYGSSLSAAMSYDLLELFQHFG